MIEVLSGLWFRDGYYGKISNAGQLMFNFWGGGSLWQRRKRLDEGARFYEVPHGECVLVLSGPEWWRNYGYFRQHIHNLDEIGFCLDGTVICSPRPRVGIP